jgi:hypothetical protein
MKGLMVLALAAAMGCGGGPVAGGTLVSKGGPLGDFVFKPDRCVVRGDLASLDLTDSSHPSVVMRVVHPGSHSLVVVVANTEGPSGAHETAFTNGATCTIHAGYQAVLYGDRGLGLRMDCVTADGGRVFGTAGAGVCE